MLKHKAYENNDNKSLNSESDKVTLFHEQEKL